MFSNEMLERIQGMKKALIQTRNLCKKMKTLETERASLMVEVEELKKMAESKVNALESEVSSLRNEVKALADLLGPGEEPI